MHVAYSLGWDSSGGSASCAPSLKLFSPTKGPENKVDFSFIKRCTFESFRPQLLAHYLPIHLFRCCKRGLHTLVWITSTSIQICSRSLYLTSRCNKTQSQATNACKHRHIYHNIYLIAHHASVLSRTYCFTGAWPNAAAPATCPAAALCETGCQAASGLLVTEHALRCAHYSTAPFCQAPTYPLLRCAPAMLLHRRPAKQEPGASGS